MARKTLDAMADGGVHDQVGGGFHRYSTDAEWLVPHFEKMLYDNALLAQAYAAAFAVDEGAPVREGRARTCSRGSCARCRSRAAATPRASTPTPRATRA